MAQFTGLNLSGTENKDVADALIALNRLLEFQMDGHLDSGNILEVGGWSVGPTDLMSKDMDVGMSTDDSYFNPVRFWAGGSNKDFAPWRVHQDGTMHAVGAALESTTAYPKLVLDSTGLYAYDPAGVKRISLSNQAAFGYYELQFFGQSAAKEGSLSGTSGQMNVYGTNKLLIGAGSGGMYIDAATPFVDFQNREIRNASVTAKFG